MVKIFDTNTQEFLHNVLNYFDIETDKIVLQQLLDYTTHKLFLEMIEWKEKTSITWLQEKIISIASGQLFN